MHGGDPLQLELELVLRRTDDARTAKTVSRETTPAELTTFLKVAPTSSEDRSVVQGDRARD